MVWTYGAFQEEEFLFTEAIAAEKFLWTWAPKFETKSIFHQHVSLSKAIEVVKGLSIIMMGRKMGDTLRSMNLGAIDPLPGCL